MTNQILIVDDVATNVLLLRRMVERIDDTKAVTFTAPAEALAWCEVNEPDLVLLDYLMPEMDGVDFLCRFRAQPHLATIPVVVVTGQEDRPSLYRALEAGANDFLTKPVDELELLARARNMLKLRSATRDLYRLATTDELTGLANRRHFLLRLVDEVARAMRYPQPTALALLDLDHFKRINDTHGHAAGDAVLQVAAGLCREVLRDVDSIGRIGGEEFAVLMPGTDLAGARIVCERLRLAVEQAQVETPSGTVRPTISIGVAERRPEEDSALLLLRADNALYRAKQNGRNRVEAADAVSAASPPPAAAAALAG
jgi:diguanylate cyclase (GGDEF)-like protein